MSISCEGDGHLSTRFVAQFWSCNPVWKGLVAHAALVIYPSFPVEKENWSEPPSSSPVE